MRAEIWEKGTHQGPGTAELTGGPKAGPQAERELREQPRLVGRREELSQLASALDLAPHSPSSVSVFSILTKRVTMTRSGAVKVRVRTSTTVVGTRAARTITVKAPKRKRSRRRKR